jgi:hypothetical protein
LGKNRDPPMRLVLTLIFVLLAAALRAQNSFSPKLTQFLLGHPAASLALSNVLAEASSERTVQVYYFYTHDETAPKAHHNYLGDSTTVGIFVRENQPAACDECIGVLFEILKSKGDKRFRELWGQAKSGSISKMDFVTEVKRQEFQAVQAVQNLIRTFDLKAEEIAASSSYRLFMETPKSFEAFLAYSRKVSTGETYEELYDRIRKSAP